MQMMPPPPRMFSALRLEPLVECVNCITPKTPAPVVQLVCSRAMIAIRLKHRKRSPPGAPPLYIDALLELLEAVLFRVEAPALRRILQVHSGHRVPDPHLFPEGEFCEDWQRWNTFCCMCERRGGRS